MFLKKNVISFVLSASIHFLVLAYIVYDEKLIRSDTSMTIVNVVESTIARNCDWVLPIHAGPEIGVASTKAFLGQLIVYISWH